MWEKLGNCSSSFGEMVVLNIYKALAAMPVLCNGVEIQTTINCITTVNKTETVILMRPTTVELNTDSGVK